METIPFPDLQTIQPRPAMILVGRYLSPFVRRVGVSLNQLGFAFERKILSTATDKSAIEAFNPVGRVPSLELDSGEVLIDSSAILDYLDEEAGPARRLVPASGAERRQVLKIVAVALGTVEKAVGATYEMNRRPADKVHQPWLDQLLAQTTGGLAALEAALAGDFFVANRLTQADITVACGYGFIARAQSMVVPPGRYPRLDRLVQRLEATPAFQKAQPEQV
jgi:glutathione S-transferase